MIFIGFRSLFKRIQKESFFIRKRRVIFNEV